MSSELITTIEDEVAFIYKITVKNKVYIGSTINLTNRNNSHRNSLLKGTHHNAKLQRAYDKHKDYKFEIIEECSRIDRWVRESHWIIEYNSIEKGYNIAGVDITVEAIKGEHLLRSTIDDEGFITLYKRWESLIRKYWEVEFVASGSINPMSWLCLVNNVRKNNTRKKKIEHWNSTLDKVEAIIDKWEKLDTGFYYWSQCYFAEPHWTEGKSWNLKQNCVKHPYLLLETILQQTEDDLFNIIVKKLKQENLIRFKGSYEDKKKTYGPPVPTKEEIKACKVAKARKDAEERMSIFKKKKK